VEAAGVAADGAKPAAAELELLVKDIMEAQDIIVEQHLEEAVVVEQVKLALVQLQWVVVLVVVVVMEVVVVEQATA
jgi:hypothetical protein